MIQKIHHIGIAVHSLDEALRFYSEILGLPVHKQAVVKQQGVKAALLTIGESEIELLEPLDPETPVGRFLERRGEGLHHVCFQTDGIDEELDGLKAKGVELIDEKPRIGLAGRICFLHPRAMKGVLVELAEPLD
jgi:methylmalonyl-CoA/ethylmalonyl-CoA epimerase